MEAVKKTLASRKSLLFLLLFIASTTFVFLGSANFIQWADFMRWLFGLYVGGNIARHGSRDFSRRRIQQDDKPEEWQPTKPSTECVCTEQKSED